MPQRSLQTAVLPIRNSEPAAAARPGMDRGLLLIGLFKLGKFLLFFTLGLGAVHLIDRNLGDEVIRLATALRRDPEGKFVQLLLTKVSLIDAHDLRRVSIFSIAYSFLALTEGIGLMLQKRWAEFLTLGLTISFLPVELYEIVEHVTWLRVGILISNILVLLYLLWVLGQKKAKRAALA